MKNAWRILTTVLLMVFVLASSADAKGKAKKAKPAEKVNVERSLVENVIEKADYRIDHGPRSDQELHVTGRNVLLKKVNIKGLPEYVTVTVTVDAAKRGKKEVPLEKRHLSITVHELDLKIKATLLPRAGEVTLSGIPDSLVKADPEFAEGLATETLTALKNQMKPDAGEIISDVSASSWEHTKKGAAISWEGIKIGGEWLGKAIKDSFNWTKKQIHNITK